MLIRLLLTHLRPYRAAIAIVVVLPLVQTIATLYLPTLNADLIDNGVIKSDAGYILRIGALMIAITLVAGDLRHRRGLLWCPHGHGLRPRRARRALRPGPVVLGRRGRADRRALAHGARERQRFSEQGTHAELIAADGVYARLYAAQFAGVLAAVD